MSDALTKVLCWDEPLKAEPGKVITPEQLPPVGKLGRLVIPVRLRPADARFWATTFYYENQRRLRPQTVKYYRSLMENDLFKGGSDLMLGYVKGQPETMSLLNGNHRLYSLGDADCEDGIIFHLEICEFETIEQFHAEFASIDQGLKRQPGDSLTSMGVPRDSFGGHIDNIAQAIKLIDVGLYEVPRTYDVSLEELRELAYTWEVEFMTWLDLIKDRDPNHYQKPQKLLRGPVVALAMLTLRYAAPVLGQGVVEQFWRRVCKPEARYPLWSDHLGYRISRTVVTGGGDYSGKKGGAIPADEQLAIDRSTMARLYVPCWNRYIIGEKTPKGTAQAAMLKEREGLVKEPTCVAGTPFQGQFNPVFRLLDRPFVFTPNRNSIIIPTVEQWVEENKKNGRNGTH